MLCQQILSGVVYVQPVCWGFVVIPVFVQFHFSLPWSSNKLWQQAQVFVLSTARLYPFDSNVETHHPEHGSLPSSGFVPAGQTLSRGQTQHRSELTEVFRRCMSKCSCSQSALGLCGLLPSLKGKPPWSTWRTQAEWNGNGCWLSALESLSLLKSWIFKDSIFVLLSLSSWSLLLDMITNYLLMTAGFQKYCCGTRCDKCLVGKLWSHLRFPIDEPWLAWCLSLISRDCCLSVSIPP